MAKTNMTNTIRPEILKWMYGEYDKKHLPEIEKKLQKVIASVNKVIRQKYPEEDMVVLRKYSLTRKDKCLRFADHDSGQVFGIDLNFYRGYQDTPYPVPQFNTDAIVDVPHNGGCRSDSVFPCSPAANKAVHEFTSALEDWNKARVEKFKAYGAFALAVKNLEEFNETVPLPEDLKQRYMSGGALVHISPEKIAELKKEFGGKKRAA